MGRNYKKFLVLLFLISLFFSWFLARSYSRNNKGGTVPLVTRIQINSQTPGAAAYVDKSGPYPLPHTQTVSPGSHEIEFTAPGHLSQTVVLSALKAGETAKVARDLEIVQQNPWSLVPLTGTTGALSVSGNSKRAFYVTGDSVRSVLTHQLQARLPDEAQSVSWAAEGAALIKTKSGFFIYTPPYKLQKIKNNPFFADISRSGDKIFFVENGWLSLLSLNSNVPENIVAFPAAEIPVSGSVDASGGRMVLVYKTNAVYGIKIADINQKTIIEVVGGLEKQPVTAVSDDGQYVAIISAGEISILAAGSGAPIVKINQAVSGTTDAVVWHDGFIILANSRLDDGRPVVEIFRLSAPGFIKKTIIYDLPVPTRINTGVLPRAISGAGLVLKDNAGGWWYLGDPTNLPESLFSRSLPKEIFDGAF